MCRKCGSTVAVKPNADRIAIPSDIFRTVTVEPKNKSRKRIEFAHYTSVLRAYLGLHRPRAGGGARMIQKESSASPMLMGTAQSEAADDLTGTTMSGFQDDNRSPSPDAAKQELLNSIAVWVKINNNKVLLVILNKKNNTIFFIRNTFTFAGCSLNSQPPFCFCLPRLTAEIAPWNRFSFCPASLMLCFERTPVCSVRGGGAHERPVLLAR